MSKAWQEKERLVGEWFGSTRNPLSGRNNVDDNGNRRLGDVIHPLAVIEVKRRKNNSTIIRAKETRDLAKKHNKPWVHLEFATSQPEIVSISLNYEEAKKICKLLNIQWEINQP